MMTQLLARPAFLGVEEWTEALIDGEESESLAAILASNLLRLGWEVILDGEPVGDDDES